MPTSRSFRSVRFWYRIKKHGSNFFGSQWAGGVMLVVFTVLALVVANLDATKHIYH